MGLGDVAEPRRSGMPCVHKVAPTEIELSSREADEMRSWGAQTRIQRCH